MVRDLVSYFKDYDGDGDDGDSLVMDSLPIPSLYSFEMFIQNLTRERMTHSKFVYEDDNLIVGNSRYSINIIPSNITRIHFVCQL